MILFSFHFNIDVSKISFYIFLFYNLSTFQYFKLLYGIAIFLFTSRFNIDLRFLSIFFYSIIFLHFNILSNYMELQSFFPLCALISIHRMKLRVFYFERGIIIVEYCKFIWNYNHICLNHWCIFGANDSFFLSTLTSMHLRFFSIFFYSIFDSIFQMITWMITGTLLKANNSSSFFPSIRRFNIDASKRRWEFSKGEL